MQPAVVRKTSNGTSDVENFGFLSLHKSHPAPQVSLSLVNSPVISFVRVEQLRNAFHELSEVLSMLLDVLAAVKIVA